MALVAAGQCDFMRSEAMVGQYTIAKAEVKPGRVNQTKGTRRTLLVCAQFPPKRIACMSCLADRREAALVWERAHFEEEKGTIQHFLLNIHLGWYSEDGAKGCFEVAQW